MFNERVSLTSRHKINQDMPLNSINEPINQIISTINKHWYFDKLEVKVLVWFGFMAYKPL